MVKAVFRRKSIGTKVSEEEYARLEALAGGRAMSEWTREVLLRELDGRQARPADETLLAEVLALRTILLNAFYKLAQGEKLTAEGADTSFRCSYLAVYLRSPGNHRAPAPNS